MPSNRGWTDNSLHHTSSSYTSSSTSSLASSSAASDMPLPDDSSQSDIVSSDHYIHTSHNTPQLSGPNKHAVGHDFAVAAPGQLNGNPSSLALVMGQNYSKPSSHKAGLSISTAAANTGFKIKRAFGNARRKKSEDATKVFAGKEQQDWDSPSPVSSHPSSSSSQSQVITPTPKSPSSARQLTRLATQVVTGGRKASTSSPQSPGPPTPPPKPLFMQPAKLAPPSLPSTSKTQKTEYRGSIIPMSPGISSAVNFMRLNEEELSKEKDLPKDSPKEVPTEKADDQTKSAEQKDIWRKSDSTMSHHTIRPGAAAGPRSSRPVSMAESLQSNHTVIAVNKRLSALITDAEFGPPEEEDDDSSFKSASEEILQVQATSTPASATTSSQKVKSQRSMSLNLGPLSPKLAITPLPVTAPKTVDDHMSSPKQPSQPRMTPSASASETPTLTRLAANGFIAPSSIGVQSTGNNIRGRLAAWTATNNNTASPNHHHASRPAPPSAYHRNSPSPQPHQRTATISITGSLAPAANLARRAAEKLGRWGGFSSSSGGSGYSSSSSSTGYSSDHGLGRTISKDSSSLMSSSGGRGKPRRTPEAPSGAWSISSSGAGSTSDSDAFLVPAGPLLGTQIRGPLRMNAGGPPVAGGILFGRRLSVVVSETAVGVGLPNYGNVELARPAMETPGVLSTEQSRELENRRVPALVVRCAQHLLLWGVGEEGLFRVSGRPSHVSKLRHEFDTGADFNLQQCSPGELDPHAVASIFKAFLRELPEPILTNSLLPYFDAALAHENATNEQHHQQDMAQRVATSGIGARGPTLPSGPKSGLQNLRKPPSLSTLAMPNFNSLRPPSRSFINVMKNLVGQLPAENKDLIRTVTELIKATAKESRQTKMPLSNLLLVFCPSLSMNPGLLRALCEAEEIWETADEEVVAVLDIKRDDLVLDISPSSEAAEAGHSARPEGADDKPALPAKERQEQAEVDETPASVSQESQEVTKISLPLISSSPASGSRVADHVEMRPSFERKITGEDRKNGIRAKKPQGPRKAAHVPAVVHADSQHAGPAEHDFSSRTNSPDVLSESMSLHDDGSSYLSTSDSRSESVASPFEPGISSPPLLSSSAESLTTPSSSSAEPSSTHLPLEKTSLDADPLKKAQITDEDIMTPRRFLDNRISGAIEFPKTTEDIPSSPRMSAPNLLISSFPDSPSSTNSAPASPASPRARRLKKPSLQLLFSKRSSSPQISPSEGKPFISSPMPSPYLRHPSTSTSSSSSMSTPLSAVTAPQGSTFTLPPVLDTPIESSPLRFGFGLDTQSSRDPNEKLPQIEEPEPESVTVPVGETPIANRYCTPSSSTLSLSLTDVDAPSASSQLRPYLTRSKKKTASSNHLGLLDTEDQEDWTQSVLLAADADGNWSLST